MSADRKNSDHEQLTFELPAGDPLNFYGPQDEVVTELAKIFPALQLFVTARGLKISGSAKDVASITGYLAELTKVLADKKSLEAADVRELHSQPIGANSLDPQNHDAADDTILLVRGKKIRPQTAGQRKYVRAIAENTITFGLGPAGTGKTFLAVAMAVKALQERRVSKIILTRPAVEAGERLGYLPGSLSEKIDPYLRPLFDAAAAMLEPDAVGQLLSSGAIEVAPLAYMRGRTLNESFVILDEAQNTTPDQMKMFLTRLGYGSQIVVTGDPTQADLPGGRSGLTKATRVLAKVSDISFNQLTSDDIVRHALVGRIVDAYDRYEKKKHEKENG